MGRQIYAERQRHVRREDLSEPDEPVIENTATRERVEKLGDAVLDLLDAIDLELYDHELGGSPDPDEERVDEPEPVAV